MDDKDYLIHYGVLGMKWGVRHDKERKAKQRQIDRERFESEIDAADRYDKKRKKAQSNKNLSRKDRKAAVKKAISEYASEVDRIEKNAEKKTKKNTEDTYNRRYSLNSKKTNKRLSSMGLGEALAKSVLLGSYGAYRYESLKASGKGTGYSAVVAGLNDYGNRTLLNIPGFLEGHANRKARKKQ